MVAPVCYTGSVGWAFGIPGILMGLATIAFWMGRHKFIHVPSNPGGKLGLLDVLSGTFLANMIIYPLFLKGQFGTDMVGTAIVIVASFMVHLAIFFYRQKIEPDDGFLAIFYFSVAGLLRGNRGTKGFFTAAKDKYGEDIVEGPIAVLRILSVFLMVSVFWGLFDQHSTTWLKQAQLMDRQLGSAVFTFDPSAAYGLVFPDSGELFNEWILIGLGLGLVLGLTAYVSFASRSRKLLGLLVGVGSGLAIALLAYENGGYYDMQASQIPAINPFLVMLLIPATTFGIYPLMNKVGFTAHPLRRMTIGMFMASLAFVAVAFVQLAIDEAAERGETVHVVWQVIPYVIMTLSEVMVSITGLEFGYSQAPKRVKSVIMGIWLLMVSLGNVLVAFVANFQMGPLEFFWLFAGLMAIAALLFGLRAATYTYKDYAQG